MVEDLIIKNGRPIVLMKLAQDKVSELFNPITRNFKCTTNCKHVINVFFISHFM